MSHSPNSVGERPPRVRGRKERILAGDPRVQSQDFAHTPRVRTPACCWPGAKPRIFEPSGGSSPSPRTTSGGADPTETALARSKIRAYRYTVRTRSMPSRSEDGSPASRRRSSAAMSRRSSRSQVGSRLHAKRSFVLRVEIGTPSLRRVDLVLAFQAPVVSSVRFRPLPATRRTCRGTAGKRVFPLGELLGVRLCVTLELPPCRRANGGPIRRVAEPTPESRRSRELHPGESKSWKGLATVPPALTRGVHRCPIRSRVEGSR